MAKPGETRVSVVLCTRNRAAYLPDALASYDHVKASVPWELVIVDNGSNDGTDRLLREFRGKSGIDLHILFEPRPGLSRARNAGWRAAKGEIVAFTDDDCYPQHDFVDEVWRNFSESDLGYLGGKILLFDPLDYPITIQPRASRLAIAPQSYLRPGFIQGANMAVRRDVIERLGGFDEVLGAGTPYPSEDVDLLSRASAAGWLGAYDPRPVVFHHHRRRTIEQIKALRRTYGLGRGAYFMKCMLDATRRKACVKNWYWNLRADPRDALINIYEVAGALGYLLARARSGVPRSQPQAATAELPRKV